MLKENEFFVTVFSNSSQDYYPDNTISKFTTRLPRPIKLDGNYKVGLIEIQYPPIVGVINTEGDDQEDCITIPVTRNNENTKVSIENFINILVMGSKRCELYTNDRYYEEFMDVKKLDNFEKNFQEYRDFVGKPGQINNEGIKGLYEIVPTVKQFRSEDFKTIPLNPIGSYKMKHMIYKFLQYYFHNYKKFTQAELSADYKINQQKYIKGVLLKQNLREFIDIIKSRVELNYAKKPDTMYLAVHCDIIAPRIIGGSISKVLYFGSKALNSKLEETYVQNVQYIPVIKDYMEEISFFISDETGTRVLFESGYKPLSITLHFVRMV